MRSMNKLMQRIGLLLIFAVISITALTYFQSDLNKRFYIEISPTTKQTLSWFLV